MNRLSVMITPKETSLVWKIAAKVHNEYCPSGEASEITTAGFFSLRDHQAYGGEKGL